MKKVLKTDFKLEKEARDVPFQIQHQQRAICAIREQRYRY